MDVSMCMQMHNVLDFFFFMIHFDSVVYLMNIISQPINLSNGSDPCDEGKATSISDDG